MASRLFRLFALLWAVASAALPGAFAIADARAEAATAHAERGHIESHRTDTCPPAHAADCATCLVLSHGAGRPSLAARPAALLTAASAHDGDHSPRTTRRAAGAARPRAPPV